MELKYQVKNVEMGVERTRQMQIDERAQLSIRH
jgi:hypothetical protein